MKKRIGIIAAVAVTQLCGCIELRDKNKSAQNADIPPVVAVQKFSDQVVDEEMFIYDGKILNAQDLEKAKRENAEIKKVVKNDFDLKFDRLTITDRGVLYTLGNNVRFHVHDFKANSGAIATFPEGQTAANDQEGRSGGYILLDVDQAEGFLNIFMRGERGGKGSDGAPPDASLKGHRGENADSCAAPNPKVKGENGNKGHNGLSGGKGGDSGALEVKIKNDTDFTYNPQLIPGLGGAFGRGGDGGEGGDDGLYLGPNCFFSNQDVNGNRYHGKKGDSGIDGHPGSPGAKQTICVHKAGTIICRN